MAEKIIRDAVVPPEKALQRLDRVASDLFPEFSRSRLQGWIKSGELTVDGELRRPKDKVHGGEELEIEAVPASVGLVPEPIPLVIVHEDADVLVVDKPAGMVVHPGAGNSGGTLLNALLHHDPALAGVPRAGIVHRLDKDTSGLLVVAKTLRSQNALVQQLQERSVSRIYEAVVYGVVERGGRIEAPIGRDPRNRLKMAIVPTGKEAITRFEVVRRFAEHTQLRLSLETGRTHQIRVHLQKLGFPLIGDHVYGGGYKEPARKKPALIEALRAMQRQALHARRLSFTHPGSEEMVTFEAPLPPDMMALLQRLEACEA